MDINNEKDNEGNTAAHYYAYGCMWLMFFLGLGGCCYLAHVEGHSGPLIQISTSKP